MNERMKYGQGTYLNVTRPWSLYIGGAVLCADGVVRRLARVAATADTFSSVPAAVKANGRTVAGYVTLDDDQDGPVAVFRAYTYGKNAGAIVDVRTAARAIGHALSDMRWAS